MAWRQSRGRAVVTIAATQGGACASAHSCGNCAHVATKHRDRPRWRRPAPQACARHMSGGCCVSAQTGVAVQGATSAGWRAWAALEPRWTTPGRPCKPRTTRHKSGPSAAQRQTLSFRNRAQGWVSLCYVMYVMLCYASPEAPAPKRNNYTASPLGQVSCILPAHGSFWR